MEMNKKWIDNMINKKERGKNNKERIKLMKK